MECVFGQNSKFAKILCFVGFCFIYSHSELVQNASFPAPGILDEHVLIPAGPPPQPPLGLTIGYPALPSANHPHAQTSNPCFHASVN
jgi:hypothetical protein